MRLVRKLLCALLACLALVLVPSLGHADPSFYYSFQVDTSALQAGPGTPPYSLIFQFTDGAGTNIGNNTATVSGLTFHGGGGLVNNIATLGTPTGGLGLPGIAAPLVLQDRATPTQFSQEFTPGDHITFTVNLTANADDLPDSFSFAIGDDSGGPFPPGTNIPTAMTGGSLIVLDTSLLDGVMATVITDFALAPFTGVLAFQIPEPSSLALFALGLSGAAAGHWLRRRNPTLAA